MKARFMIENPKEIECTMEITMTVKEWEELRDQLVVKYPSFKLSKAVTSILNEVRKVYYASENQC